MSSVKRKLAAIVAADVVGYSRLMGANEEETIAQLRAYRSGIFEPKLKVYRGRVANTAGDSFLIEFASAVDALRFSMDVQSEVNKRNLSVPEDSRLQFRFGINLGDVVEDGSDLLGDGVNVAARIEALAEPGEICISRSVRDQVRDRIDIEFVDLGEIEVKNIARPIRVFRVLVDGISTGSAKPHAVKKPPGWKPVALAAAVLIAISAAGWWGIAGNKPFATEQPEGPKIAVIPFANLSGEASESYFSSGITEDIATDLSNVSGLTVTSISAARNLDPGTPDFLSTAAEMGVGHLVEGTVRRSAGRIRITAKLTDAETGNQIWAERFDRKSEDIFSVQDEITGRVIEELSAIFGQQSFDRKKRAYTPDPLAYDYYIKGRAQRIPPTPPNLKAAFESFNKAIEIDPQFAGGYAGAAITTILAASDSTRGSGNTDDGLQKALELAKKAVELDPTFGPGWGSLAEAYLRTGDHEKSLEAAQRAMEFAPSDSLMRANYGRYLGYIGRADEGIEQVKQATRMSPDSLPMLYFLGANQRSKGLYKEAIDSLVEHRKRLAGRILPAPTVQLIAAYSQAGLLEEARTEAEKLLKTAPGFSVAKAVRIHPYKSAEDQKAFEQALLSAGIPQ